VLAKFGWDRAVGLGVIDVKNPEVESAELVARRIRAALELVPADRLMINPDCGLRHLTETQARAKLATMVQAPRSCAPNYPPHGGRGPPTTPPSRRRGAHRQVRSSTMPSQSRGSTCSPQSR